MSVLTDAAAQAYADELAAEAAALENLKAQLRDGAKAAITAMIAPVTWANSALQRVDTDLDNLIVFFSDGTITLSATQTEGGGWRIRLVEKVDGQWTRKSNALQDLGDLGRAIAEASA